MPKCLWQYIVLDLLQTRENGDGFYTTYFYFKFLSFLFPIAYPMISNIVLLFSLSIGTSFCYIVKYSCIKKLSFSLKRIMLQSPYLFVVIDNLLNSGNAAYVCMLLVQLLHHGNPPTNHDFPLSNQTYQQSNFLKKDGSWVNLAHLEFGWFDLMLFLYI